MVVLRLYPPYSTIVGKKETQVDPRNGQLGVPGLTAAEFFSWFCDQYPALRELFFPSGSDFPGSASVLRDGLPVKGTDVIRPGDVLEVLTALSGG